MKNLKNKIISLVLIAVVICSASAISISAVNIPTVNSGESWSQTWDGSMRENTGDSQKDDRINFFNVSVDEKGLYYFKITDNKLTGFPYITVFDLTCEESLGAFSYGEITAVYESELFLLSPDHQYEICVTYTDAEYAYTDADLKIDFLKNDTVVEEIPDCILDLSSLTVTFGQKNAQYVKFSPTQTGEYTLHTNGSVNGYFDVFDYDTAENVDYSEVCGSKTVVYLEKDKTYYFRCCAYEDIQSNISITYNTNQLKSVTIISARHTLWFNDSDLYDSAVYNFKVVYKNNSVENLSGAELSERGYNFYVYPLGNSITFADNSVGYLAGKQPFRVTFYADNTECNNITYLDVNSATDMLINNNEPIIGRNKDLVLLNDNAEDLYHHGFYRIKVDQTGYYSFNGNASSLFSANCGSNYGYSLYDKNNNHIKYDKTEKAFLMVKDQEYALCVEATFKSALSNDICVTLTKHAYVGFPDVNPADWCYDAIIYANGRNIISGYSNGYFGTSDGIQRQDFVVILSRMENYIDYSEKGKLKNIFGDMDNNGYYAEAIKWGFAKGIVSGYLNGNFGVGDLITREQLVTFLYRYAKYKEMDVSITNDQINAVKNSYDDYYLVSDFAQEAIVWAISNGVINGNTPTTINPQGNAQRCEVAQIMYNMFRNDVIA